LGAVFCQRFNVFYLQQALAFHSAPVAPRQTLRQGGIGRAVARIAHRFEVALRDQTGTGHKTNARLTRGNMAAHNTGQRVAVGKPDGLIAKMRGALHHFLRMRAALQKTEIRNRRQLGKARIFTAHGNTPCMNQRTRPVSRP
jgi:hypothetical protein